MSAQAEGRHAWVDYAKGICLVAVVTFYTASYVQAHFETETWVNHWVEFARPFRMPDFFLLSGLFLARTIDRPWASYLDTKVAHFAYFLVLWTTVYFAAEAVQSPGTAASSTLWADYLDLYVEPYHMLWFIQMLPVFFLVTRLTRRVPWPLMLAIAGLLQVIAPETGYRQLDRFCERFVYFYAGYAFAPAVFALAARAAAHRYAALAAIAVWAFTNEAFVLAGLADAAGLSLLLGFAGAAAVMAVGSLLTGSRGMDWLRYLGQNSIVVFLAFFLFMVAGAKFMWRLDLVEDVGTQIVLLSGFALAGPVVLCRAVRHTPLRYLFERPAWARRTARRHAPPPAVPASR